MILIVTDSTVNVTRAQAAKLGLQVLPMGYMVDGQRYLETYTDCNGSFEALLQSKNFLTSQVSFESFVSCFSESIRRGDEVLCIVISSRLSGTYRNAFAAAAQINSAFPQGQEKVIVVDSLSTAGGMLLLCEEAIKMIGQKLTLHQLAQQVEECRKKISVVFSLDSMDALRKSGRIGIVRQSVSTILNIRPLLRCQNGAVVSLGTVRGRMEQIRKMMQEIKHTPERIALNVPQQSASLPMLEQELKEKFPGVFIEKNDFGPVLSHHLGRGLLALSWIEK